MSVFKTPKGTEIELIKLKNKDYMLVAHRLIWFNEEVEFYDIKSEFHKMTDDETICSVTVTTYDKDRKQLRSAVGTKRETKKDFPDHLEKAQSSALGRALSMMSFGTAQAIADFDELTNEKGDVVNRLADAPIDSPKIETKPKPAAPTEAPKTTKGFTRVNKPAAAASKTVEPSVAKTEVVDDEWS